MSDVPCRKSLKAQQHNLLHTSLIPSAETGETQAGGLGVRRAGGFTKEGQERAQGFEGCISTLKAMTIIAKVPEDKRSPTQLRRVQRFQEFGCSTCHKVSPGKVGLTEAGAKLASLHLGCVEVEKLVAAGPAPNR